MKKVAWIFGATGLIGRELLQLLIEDLTYTRIDIFVRRPWEGLPGKVRVHVDPLKDIRSLSVDSPADALFCCLGTTMAKAGSKEAFRRVDYTLPLEIGRWARDLGVPHYLIVTAMGADPDSAIFYNRVKGEVERDLAALGFPQLSIAQPSLLLGDREESRLGEGLAQRIMPLFHGLMVGPLRKYRAIEGQTVARALQRLSHDPTAGGTYSSEALAQLGQPG
ncbi:MAG: oxidoreductase [Bacteroidetes bacterium]|nr:MAG: oxidoreductase [Bacteroidota bacterium]